LSAARGVGDRQPGDEGTQQLALARTGGPDDQTVRSHAALGRLLEIQLDRAGRRYRCRSAGRSRSRGLRAPPGDVPGRRPAGRPGPAGRAGRRCRTTGSRPRGGWRRRTRVSCRATTSARAASSPSAAPTSRVPSAVRMPSRPWSAASSRAGTPSIAGAPATSSTVIPRRPPGGVRAGCGATRSWSTTRRDVRQVRAAARLPGRTGGRSPRVIVQQGRPGRRGPGAASRSGPAGIPPVTGCSGVRQPLHPLPVGCPVPRRRSRRSAGPPGSGSWPAGPAPPGARFTHVRPGPRSGRSGRMPAATRPPAGRARWRRCG